LDGLKNVLAELGMLPRHATQRPRQLLLHRIDIVRPHEGGLFVPRIDRVGVQVAKGDVLGQVVSPLDFAVLEDLTCPLEEGVVILTHPTTHRMEPGDYGFMVGDMQTAEPLDD
jgi:predicted deacylase